MFSAAVGCCLVRDVSIPARAQLGTAAHMARRHIKSIAGWPPQQLGSAQAVMPTAAATADELDLIAAAVYRFRAVHINAKYGHIICCYAESR